MSQRVKFFLLVDFFFIIEEGEVTLKNSDDQITTLTKGNIFGHHSLLLNCRQVNSATCQSVMCILSVFHSNHFYSFIQPYIAQKDSIIFGKPIGIGGTCIVKSGELKEDKSIKLAVKMIRKNNINRIKEEMVIREKKIWSQLRSSFLVSLISTYQDNSYFYFVAGLEEGGDLRNVIQFNSSNKFKLNIILFIMSCIAVGLKYMHKMNIIYRGIKPENLLLDLEGYVKLCDFGSCKIIDNKTYTIVGTPEYIPPEVWLGKGQTLTGDFWSIGILIYELINGETPFTNHNNSLVKVINKNRKLK